MAARYVTVLLFFFVWKAGCTDEGKRDPEFEAYILEVLNNFRSIMEVGIPEIKVPPLDPLRLYNIKINVNEKEAKVDLVFHEINIFNLSKFKVENLESNLGELYIKFNLTLPHILVSGTYDLKGMIIKLFPLYGNGNYEVEATKANIGGTGKMKLDKDGLQFINLSLDLSWNTLKVNFENLLKGGAFSKVLQRVFPSLGKGLFDHFKPEILSLVNKALINEVNKELKKPEVRKIIDGLIPREVQFSNI